MIMPDVMYKLLNGKHLEDKQEIVFILQTVTVEGYPHTAMLSVGEIVAIDMTHIRLALWPNTKTVQGLRLNGKANIVFVYDYQVYYVELDTREYISKQKDTYNRAKFVANVQQVKVDNAKYADVTSGISIQLHHPQDTILRWQTTVADLLRD
ncbi:pyridoxamine 5'-phosphate oxidase family protein [Staphylococcus gallinarum]|uniref:Pyridoxamine 5'-phosphate oxidase family protein n=1 Tax=Staphylococcus gallinarum TaxID=1293 RepID=A0A3A0VV35_STAGA|nr:pyridoxamine 5'-phosphate oxidase family protein [Staphylococcus gallinarum]RIP37069.1 pyridoxamine 5'-phosphate oxidase family protein [Staphylococcus gallinarum]